MEAHVHFLLSALRPHLPLVYVGPVYAASLCEFEYASVLLCLEASVFLVMFLSPLFFCCFCFCFVLLLFFFLPPYIFLTLKVKTSHLGLSAVRLRATVKSKSHFEEEFLFSTESITLKATTYVYC